MRRHRTSLLVVLTIALVAVALLGLVLSMTAPDGEDLNPVSRAVYLSNPVVLGIIAGILLIRLPGHWSGRALLAVTLAFDVDSLAKAVLTHHQAHDSWTLGLVRWAAWFDNWTWTIIFDGTLFIIIKFAGTDRRGRWLRYAGWSGLVTYGVLMVLAGSAASSADFDNIPTIVTGGLNPNSFNQLLGILFVLGNVSFVCAVIAVLLRWRGSSGAEQAQLRWLIWAFGSVIGAGLLDAGAGPIVHALHADAPLLLAATDVLQELSVLTIPVALCISVTRYGLFEIDRVVSRTVSYTVLVLLLTASYVTIVTSASRLVPDRLGSLPVAAATLAVAALFVPVRRRLIASIDRRFNRARFDAERVIGAFAERVRHEDANDPHGADLLTAVQQVFQPATASVWLLPPRTARP